MGDTDSPTMRRRQSSVSSSSSSSSDWDAEVFEEEEAELMRLQNIAHSAEEVKHECFEEEYMKKIRPKSTPFRSSKGTSVFLSAYNGRSSLFGGNLNELINEKQQQKSEMIKSNNIKY